MDRPRILLTTSTVFRHSDLRRHDSLTGRNYSQAIVLAGGLPFMVSNLAEELAEEYVQYVDAVLFSGGGDIDPSFYGQQPQQGLGNVDLERDRFELALFNAARERGLPVLGLCRGIQLINVAQGGSLHQHLPDLPQALKHSQVAIDGMPSHAVTLDPASQLAKGLKCEELSTNSYHHQGIDRLGDGLRVVGRTADGLAEAIEGTQGAPLLAVQWHPEMSFTHDNRHLLPFQLLVEAASLRPELEPRGE